MAVSYAVRSRMLQFRAGPQESRFYACDRHLPNLLRGDVDLFFARDWDLSQPEDPENEIECWWCRGEDGP